MAVELDPRFEPAESGPYMKRDGPARARGEEACRQKLCLVATDRQLLANVLHDLSLEENCFFVKLSINPTDGMYLGRCLLTSAERVGHLWAELKQHGRLFCSVQDDDFVAPFREDTD